MDAGSQGDAKNLMVTGPGVGETWGVHLEQECSGRGMVRAKVLRLVECSWGWGVCCKLQARRGERPGKACEHGRRVMG